ncbi:MAG: VWA domain-containing protein, partial [Terriglobia bacterium]
MTPHPLSVLRWVFLCLLCSTPAGAQPEKPYAVRVEVALVNLDVAVVDAGGQFVGGLRERNFRVFEEGREQTITHFASMEAPLTLALLVETSPAVYLIRSDYLQALHTLLDHLKPTDAVALARYDQHWQAVADFTRDKALLRRQLRRLNYSLGMAELNLFDALAQTLDWLAPAEASVPGRKAVLLVGTGLDTRSQIARETVEEKLGASQVTLFAIATGSLLRAPPEEKARRKRKRSDRVASRRTEAEA